MSRRLLNCLLLALVSAWWPLSAAPCAAQGSAGRLESPFQYEPNSIGAIRGVRSLRAALLNEIRTGNPDGVHFLLRPREDRRVLVVAVPLNVTGTFSLDEFQLHAAEPRKLVHWGIVRHEAHDANAFLTFTLDSQITLDTPGNVILAFTVPYPLGGALKLRFRDESRLVLPVRTVQWVVDLLAFEEAPMRQWAAERLAQESAFALETIPILRTALNSEKDARVRRQLQQSVLRLARAGNAGSAAEPGVPLAGRPGGSIPLPAIPTGRETPPAAPAPTRSEGAKTPDRAKTAERTKTPERTATTRPGNPARRPKPTERVFTNEVVRIWTDATGKHRTKASLVAVRNGAVQLRRGDGRDVTVPLDKLSRLDRQYVERKMRD